MSPTQLTENASLLATFHVRQALCALDASAVQEVVRFRSPTPIRHAPPEILGVINLRGNILPVIDARIKFGLCNVPFTIDSCIIVIGIGEGKEPLLVGVLVDSVREVIDIPGDAIQPSPGIGAFYNNELVVGMGSTGGDFAMILNPDKVFAAEELAALAAAS
jgi:purine-binding chemotaxis protein CheW